IIENKLCHTRNIVYPEIVQEDKYVTKNGNATNTFFWNGPSIDRLIFCCRIQIVKPRSNDHAPTCRNCGGFQGIRPNRLNSVVGSGADKSLIEPKKGACRISMGRLSTLKKAKSTRNWIRI